MTGTASQVEWAERIKAGVFIEFDRVAKALLLASHAQAEPDRSDTLALIAIVDEKRAEVMARNEAGYFIHVWQELNDQVRQMIGRDARYQAIKAARLARKRADPQAAP